MRLRTTLDLSRHARRAFRSRALRGFTLVELMVAITGGLFVAIIVFIMARNTGRFYQSETRIGEATLGSVVGFERLRAEIGRAAFLSSPNVRADPFVCNGPQVSGGWPALLGQLASLQISQQTPTPNGTLAANNLAPDQITIMGSLASVDQFPITNVDLNATGGFRVSLSANNSAMARLGYPTAVGQASRETLLATVFGIGRGLRIADKKGRYYYGVISAVDATTTPDIILAPLPSIPFSTNDQVCGISGFCVGCVASVVNFVRYDVRTLKNSPNAATPDPYAPIYADGGANPTDGDRTELTRVELDATGTPIVGTEELVTEYAVDLKFGLTVATAGNDPTVSTLPLGSPQIPTYAGPTGGATPATPQRIRAVRVRLSVRSAEADRNESLDNVPGIAQGLYRIGLGPNKTAPFARVRTVQADIVLNNTMGATWP